jgi:hypothetical protein
MDAYLNDAFWSSTVASFAAARTQKATSSGAFTLPNFGHLFTLPIHVNDRHRYGASGLGLKGPGP